MTRILITGGTGSLGSALVARWYHHHELTIISRDPHKQARMTALYPDVRYILADINNSGEMHRACLGQEVVIHAAALKDVQTGEFHPSEFARVNVQGTITIAEAWHKTHQDGIGRVLLVSSDKAVSSLNCYGATKKVGEAVFRKYDYSVVRYGNVIESNGSFIHKWKAAAGRGEAITVREPEPTRFYLSMGGAIDLIEDALRLIHADQNGIFVPHELHSFSVWEAAAATGARIERVPLLPYEKVHESLLAEGETAEPVSELLSRIKPGWDSQHVRFRSNVAPRMSGEEVLKAAGW